MIANHGQSTKYYHTAVGLNSRLDSIQAGILGVKLEYIDIYKVARQYVASAYDNAFGNLDWITIPKREIKSTHVFHQYTLKLNKKVSRDHFREYLNMRGIPSMIYYPMPMHLQDAYSNQGYQVGDFPISEELAKRVISLPIHTEMDKNQLDFITSTVKSYE